MCGTEMSGGPFTSMCYYFNRHIVVVGLLVVSFVVIADWWRAALWLFRDTISRYTVGECIHTVLFGNKL